MAQCARLLRRWSALRCGKGAVLCHARLLRLITKREFSSHCVSRRILAPSSMHSKESTRHAAFLRLSMRTHTKWTQFA
eukprot:6196041-Pleurochrysis_carterae.AAC.1